MDGRSPRGQWCIGMRRANLTPHVKRMFYETYNERVHSLRCIQSIERRITGTSSYRGIAAHVSCVTKTSPCVRTPTIEIVRLLSTGHEPSTRRNNTHKKALNQSCTTAKLYQHCTSTVPTLHQHCTSTIPALYQHCFSKKNRSEAGRLLRILSQ